MLKINRENLLGIISSLFCAFTVCMQIPTQIFIGNVHEISISYSFLVPVLMIGFVALFLVLLLPLLILKQQMKCVYALIIAALSILIWINASFMFGQYGALDGTLLTIHPFSFRSIVEMFVWVIALGISVYYRHRLAHMFLSIVTMLLISNIIVTGVDVFKIVKKNQVIAFDRFDIQKELFTFSIEKNVLLIILDSLQSTLVSEVIDANPLYQTKFDGFTFYQNTITHFPTTVASVPSIITGEVYQNDRDRNTFINDAIKNSQFLEYLKKAGFSTDVRTLGGYCGTNTFSSCSGTPTSANFKYNLLDYSLFRSVPDMLKPLIYRNNQWLLFHFLKTPKLSVAGMEMVALENFIRDAIVLDVRPSYKVLHSLMTHAPWMIDEQCNIHAVSSDEYQRGQAVCALNKMVALFDKLKQLGVYDNTLILIASDHGAGIALGDQNPSLMMDSGITSRIQGLSLATLMMKPFNAHGALKLNNAPVVLSDIPNTILASLKLPQIVNGEDIRKLKENTPRTRSYFYYDWLQQDWHKSRLPAVTTYFIRGDARDLAAWSMKTPIVNHQLKKNLNGLNQWYYINSETPDNLNTANRTLGLGWSIPEAFGVWSNGNQASIFLHCPKPSATRSLMVDLEIGGFVSEMHPEVHFSIYHQQNKLLEDSINLANRSKVITIPISENMCRTDEAYLNLIFKIDNPMSPAQLNMSEDSRVLGISISGFRYRADKP